MNIGAALKNSLKDIEVLGTTTAISAAALDTEDTYTDADVNAELDSLVAEIEARLNAVEAKLDAILTALK